MLEFKEEMTKKQLVIFIIVVMLIVVVLAMISALSGVKVSFHTWGRP